MDEKELLEWLRLQNDTPPPPDLILPVVSDGRDNVPDLFTPDPEAVQKIVPTRRLGIWDQSVSPNMVENKRIQEYIPDRNDGVENKPSLFFPSPDAVQKVFSIKRDSIWDHYVFPNNREIEEILRYVPDHNDGVKNEPILYFPSPDAVQQVFHIERDSIWDNFVFPNNREIEEIFHYIPLRNDGVPNHPILFTPTAEPQRAPGWRSPTIWDHSVFTNDRTRTGVPVTVNGGIIEDLDTLNLSEFDGFTLVLPGGEEILSSGQIVEKILTDIEPFDSIEGPLLISMYWFRANAIGITEIRLTKEEA